MTYGPRRVTAARPAEGFEERVDVAVRRSHVPTADVVVIVDVDGTIELDGLPSAHPRITVTGPHLQPVTSAHVGAQRCIELRLSLPDASAVFDVDARDLTGRTLILDDRWVDRALDPRLGWGERIHLVAQLCTTTRASPIDPVVRSAWRRLAHTSVTDVAAECGVSRTALTRRFERAVGITPKVASRLMRFERAAALITSGTDLATVAALAGYSDQSHLTREVRAFTGNTPGELVASAQTSKTDHS
jgi:AraC-like DNA-binding protein